MAPFITALLIFPSLAFATAPRAHINTSKKSTTAQLETAALYLQKCDTQFSEEAKSRGSINSWTEHAPTQTGERNFRSPTNQLGKWLELSVSTSGLPTLYVATKAETFKISFDQDCKKTATHNPGLDFSKLNPDPYAEWFDDAQLEKLMKSSPEGIIYVWSPGMVYSVQYYKYFRDVAAQMKIAFKPILGHRSDLNRVNSMTNRFAVPPSKLKLNSVELYMRNATVHAPTTFVFKNGKLHPMPIIGVLNKQDLRAAVQSELREL